MSKRDNESDLVVKRQSQSDFSLIPIILILFAVYLLFKFFFNSEILIQSVEDVVSTEKIISKPIDSKKASKINNLHEVVSKGKIEELEQYLISDSKTINEVIDGMTPIMLAATRGDVEIIDLLFTQGADPNKRGSMDRTALQYATEKNHIEVAKRLLAYGADIDAYDNGHLTSLVMAASRNLTDIALLYIEKGADVNIPHKAGWTALIDAAAHNNEKLVIALLEAGADKNMKAKNGKQAIDYARDYGFPNMVKILSK